MQIKSVERIFVKTGKWRLTLISHEQEREYTLSELRKMPGQELNFNSRTYRGVSLRTFLEKVGIDIEKVKIVKVTVADNYGVDYDRAAILEDRVILAYEMDGMPLPEKMGIVRCIFLNGDKKMQVKMVERIIVK
jgi:DMSO/TMAO reductase YedYZ molybdopterin-dependent catalytic subunit